MGPRHQSHPLGHVTPRGTAVPRAIAHDRSVPFYVKPGTIPPPVTLGVHAYYDEVEYERARAALLRETIRDELDRLLVPWREMEQRKADDRLKLNEDVAGVVKSVEHLTNHVAGLRAQVTDLEGERKAEAAVAGERRWDVKKMFLSALISTVVLGAIGLLVAGLKGAL